MAEVGYPGKSLIKKLGINTEMKILLINQPAIYFYWLGFDITGQCVLKNELPDLIHLFALNIDDFKNQMNTVLKICEKNSSVIIWVSWYKKSSGISTDLSENQIREFALQNNLVDIKVCAVSDKWSGLKLVVPLAKR